MVQTLPENAAATGGQEVVAAAPRVKRPWPEPTPAPVMRPWLRSQSVSVARHAAALRPYVSGEFGPGPQSPSEGHLQAVNALIERLRAELIKVSRTVKEAADLAIKEPSTQNLQAVVTRKQRAHDLVRGIEKVWDFYFELFGQRQSSFGNWLLSTDRIALDCYRGVYTRVGMPKPVPAPPPFTYMRTGFSPATFRRGIRLSKLGRQLNPFPLIQLPYHRMVNPWTLGAVLHEVSHNLQSDLGLSKVVPTSIARALLDAGLPASVAATWARWNRETFADLSAVLLGGPAVVGSLMDVVGRSPEQTLNFVPGKPHPTPYLRVLISCELLRRMGFPEDSKRHRKAWMRIYPNPAAGTIPAPMLETFEAANQIVVDTVCYRPLAELGDRTLAQVGRFRPEHQMMIEEAARRLAAGNDPGIVPERFLIGAARVALDRKLARPGVIATNFYKELERR
ncbi:MAG TPA: hypothetical protein VF383_15880 [Candidatus Dormibacteraeota bacterium]